MTSESARLGGISLDFAGNPSRSARKSRIEFSLISFFFQMLKVRKCRLENLPISFSSYENNMLKISH